MGKNDRLVAGVDIGGTKLYAVIADAEGRILGRGRKKTKPERGFKGVMERVVETVDEACADAKVERADLAAVGVGAPSAIREDGTAVHAPNLGWRDEPIVRTLEKLFGAPVTADNDCNVGTWGEFVFGAGRGTSSLASLFVGTGLGGGLVLDGHLHRGVNRLATEFGHLIVAAGGRNCSCGHQGCLEAYASKVGMGRRLTQEILVHGRACSLTREVEAADLLNVRSGLLADAFRAGDKVVVEAVEEMATFLGIGVGNLITTLGPEMIVLGGGVMEALGKEVLARVRESARATVFPAASFKDTKIVLAALGDDAIALGAVALVRKG